MTDFPTTIRAVRWMVRDTFRQSLATKLFWVMLGLTLLCTAFCFGVSVTGDERRERHPDEIRDRFPKSMPTHKVRGEGIPISGGQMSLGFGLVTFEIGKDRADAVKLLQLWLAGILADSVGVLLALLWTAGFLPAFLEPHSVTVLLAKPAPRWSLLLGKYVGVLLFVTLHATLFVALTWLGLGISTGTWDGAYWFAVPLQVVNFGVFFAFSAFLAVCTRSTVVSVFGTLLFWVLCWAMNYTHLYVVAAGSSGLSPAAVFLIDAGYWTLPKPLDLSVIFFDAMRAETHFVASQEVLRAKAGGHFHPEAAAVTSVLFAAGVLAVAAYEFRTMDY